MACTTSLNGFDIYDDVPTGEMGLNIHAYMRKMSAYASPKNALINGGFRFFQRSTPGTATAISDDTYGPDRWYALTQTASINYERISPGTSLSANRAVRLTQSQASAQRFGMAQIVEAADAAVFRGKEVLFQIKVRSSSTTDIRCAILEHTGTADSVTSDVVNDWTSATYTASNFFIATTVVGVSEVSATANTWVNLTVEGSVSTSCNNLVVFVWTEGTQAQNVTLDLSQALLLEADPTYALSTGSVLPWVERNFEDEYRICQRFYQKNCEKDTKPEDGVVQSHNAAGGIVRTSTEMGVLIVFPTEMRASPTLTYYRSSNGGTAGRWSYFNSASAFVDTVTATGGSSVFGVRILMTVSALTAGQSYWVKGIYTADAEL